MRICMSMHFLSRTVLCARVSQYEYEEYTVQKIYPANSICNIKLKGLSITE